MATSEYHFITHWRAAASAAEVYDLLADPLDLPRWWPAVYLEVNELEAGAPGGVGRHIGLYTKGWLPYTLRWSFRVVSADRPRGFEIRAEGDFVGRGIWTFEPDGAGTRITYDWKIQAEKPLLRRLTFLLRPLFSANHRWAMARGEESLNLELARRRARTPEERALVPAPPGPTFVRRR